MRRTVRLAGLASLLAAAAIVPAEAETTLRLSHFVPARHIGHEMLERWSKSLEEATKGGIKIQIFPSEQLGKAKDHYDMVRDGIVDISFADLGYLPGRFPIAMVGGLPLLVPDTVTAAAALREWYPAFAKLEMSDVHYCLFVPSGAPVLHSKKKFETPEDMKGVRIRAPSQWFGRLVALSGAVNTPVPAPELREAAERGILEASPFPWRSSLVYGIGKTFTFHLDRPLFITYGTILINKKRYEGLLAAEKAAVDSHCSADWARTLSQMNADWEAPGRADYAKDTKHTIYDIGADKMPAWRALADKVHAEWIAEASKRHKIDAAKALDELKAEIVKQTKSN